MKKKKSCNKSKAQGDQVIIKNGFKENEVISSEKMASETLNNRDRNSFINSSEVNGQISEIENLSQETTEKLLGTKPKHTTNDSSSSQNSKNDQHTPESGEISFATEKVNCQLQDLRLTTNDTDQKTTEKSTAENIDSVNYAVYESELQMPDIMKLIQKDLSEPYSIYTYRYFIHNWPHLCYMARVDGECVGAIVCKLDFHKKVVKRGYIAMLAVDSGHRKRKIGSTLVKRAINAMIAEEADEVVLETEITNKPALRLYENLGFVRDKRLFRYYLNGVDALRLKLWLR